MDTTSCIKCYVCGNEDDLPCTEFEIEDKRYQKECDNDKSCKISRSEQGNRILSRSCEPNQFKDCIIANFVEYCYCIKDYCNKISPSDDEDEDPIEFLEGSGNNDITENQESTSKDRTVSSSSTEKNKNSVQQNEVKNSVLVSNNQKTTSKGASQKNYLPALFISFLWSYLMIYF